MQETKVAGASPSAATKVEARAGVTTDGMVPLKMSVMRSLLEETMRSKVLGKLFPSTKHRTS